MPHEIMNEQQVAAYLRMDLREVLKLSSRGQMPCRKVGEGFQYRKGELDHWVEAQMHELAPDELHGIERGVTAHHGMDVDEAELIVPLIPADGVVVPLLARTRDAVIRALVDHGETLEVVYARDELVTEIRHREELCSTAMMPGVALPHPRHPLPYDIAESFVIVGLTPSGIPFGAVDGSLTRLFFLICCKDERTHLHVLARLAQMLHDPRAVDEMLATQTAPELLGVLARREQSVLTKRQ